MDWEDHLIKETTKARRKTLIFEQKEATELDQVFDRLSEWKALPYQIIDSIKVHDLIRDRTEKLSQECRISKNIAHAVLLKNSWDIDQAMKALSDPAYLENTFNFHGRDQEH